MTTAFKYVDVVRLLHQLGLQKASGDITIQNLVSLTRLRAGLSSELTISRHSVPNASAASKATTTWLQARGYILCRLAQRWVCIREDNEAYPTAYVTVGGHQTTISIYAYGDADEVATVKQWATETLSYEGVLFKTANHVDTAGTLDCSVAFVPHALADLARDSFYPWMDTSLVDYFKAFMASKEAILVLFGPPGTGKSTFLRTLIHSTSSQSLLVYNKEVVESPVPIQTFYDDETMKILAYEDIDNYLKCREDGNFLMSTILNACEGVIRHPGKKIVFSTNLPTPDKIDPALLRTGRCFDIMEFEKLTCDQAAVVRQDMGLPPKDFSVESVTLAEALHDNSRQTTNRFRRRIGFSN